MKKTKYFAHEAYNRHQPAIRALIKEYGMAGYGQFMTMLEILREAPNYQLDLGQEYLMEYLESELILNRGSLDQFLASCVGKYGVLRRNGDYLSNDDLMENMAKMTELSDKRRDAAHSRYRTDPGETAIGGSQAVSVEKLGRLQLQNKSIANAEQMQGKEIKPKESKINETTVKDTKGHESVPAIGSVEDRTAIPEVYPGIDPLDLYGPSADAEKPFFRGQGFFVPLILAERLCRLYDIDERKLKSILSRTDGDNPAEKVSPEGRSYFETYEEYVRDFVEKAMEYERREHLPVEVG